MNDNEIREFFQQNKPRVSDEGTFLAGLNAKMEAIAEIKKIQEEAKHRSRMAIIAALCFGIVAGGLLTAFLLIKPVSAPELNATFLEAVRSFVVEWKDVLRAVAVTAAIILGVVPWRKPRSQRS